MKKEMLRNRLKNEILVLDGAMGTLLQPHLAAGACSDMAVLEKPDVVREIHRMYSDAGADILITNTLGATRIKLDEFGEGKNTHAVNMAAVRVAREGAGGKSLVAGNIGPTGKLIDPMGDLSFDEAFKNYAEQARALDEGGAGMFILETFSDLKEIKAAVMAIRSVSELPILAAMTFEESFQTFTGTDPETAANVLTSLGIDVLGVNCSTGPEPMLEVVGRYVRSSHLPIFAEPNAGIPRLDKKGATYQIPPEEMARFSEQFVTLGANIVGSCCGSTPEYTRMIAKAVKNLSPVSRTVEPGLRLSSRTKTITIGTGLPFAIIGERLNPTNRDDLSEALETGKLSVLQNEAKAQVREGAHLLDVNIGVPGLDDAAMMGPVVQAIENVASAPLVIDSTNPKAVEAALKESTGKAIINSVHGSAESMEAIIPLAAKYGAGLLCLAVGEKGIPKTASERLDVLKRIIEQTDAAGISRDQLICDCLTLTVSAQQKRAQTTLQAIRMVKEELGLPTVLGLSNISFGLPERSLINAAFLSMAMASGLDAAIMNPADKRMMESVRAASVLTVRDKDARVFVSAFQGKKEKPAKKAEDSSPVDPIFQAVLSGSRDEIAALVQKALDSGAAPLSINNDQLIPAIQEVGKLYDQKEIFLPQMILAAETMQRAFAVLEPHFQKGDVKSAGRVVLCTVKGDVHDIGKNIVGLFLKNEGFEVIDLGKDVDSETIVREAEKHRADIVGLSALMTTTMTQMPVVIEALRKSGSKAKVMVGGAVVTKAYAKEINAHAYAKDAMEAAGKVKELVR